MKMFVQQRHTRERVCCFDQSYDQKQSASCWISKYLYICQWNGLSEEEILRVLNC